MSDEVPPMVVGRIFRIEGDLLRYVHEERDWVSVEGMYPSAKRIPSFQEAEGGQS
jgi:hypothetical protein